MDEMNTPAGETGEKVVLAGQEDRTSARSDFISSLILIVVGLATIVEALRMPSLENWDRYAHPSFPPMFFGAILVLFSLIVFVRSLYNRGYRLGITGGGLAKFVAASETKRFSFALAAIACYFLLFGRVHFVAATTFFLFIMMWYFKASKWWVNLLVSSGVAFCVWFLFNQIFLVPLP